MNKILISSLVTSAFLFSSKANAQVPTVKAVPANRITYYGANLNALVNPSNDSTTISFEYGLTTSYGTTASVSGKFTGNTTLFKTKSITGLTPGKTYHYRAKAVNSRGTTYGSDRVFAAGSSFSQSANIRTITVGDEGIVYAFGGNYSGELGDNTTTNRATPIKVLKGAYSGTTYLGDNANNPIISVVAGAAHSIALAADGSVYAFGGNVYGQLGDNTTTKRATPIKVLKGAYSGTTYLGDNANNPIISVVAGDYQSIAIAADGSVYAFGLNVYGQLGDNTTTNRATPIQVLKGAYSGTTYLGDNANNPIISVAAGQDHIIALAADGSVYAFGGNVYGQLGYNTTTNRATPIQVLKGAYSGTTYLGDNANNPIISVVAENYHSIALAADGSVYTFGYNVYGQLGDNTTTNRATPIQVLKGAYSGTTYLGDNANNPIISVASGGENHSIALAADGSVYTFGLNNYGQLGDNTTANRATPIKVLKGAYSGSAYLGDNANNPIIAVAAGDHHNIALAADGSVYTFGLNLYGQLGDNTTTKRATPIQVLGVGATGYLDLIKTILSVTLIDSVNCYGGSDGSVTTSISGGSGIIKYLWNDSKKQTTSKASNLTKGTYKLVVNDAYGWRDSITADVKEPLKLSLSVGVIDSVNCYNGSDGSITTSISGGSGSIKYLWNDAAKQTTSKTSNLTKGTYKLLVTDTYGCSDSITADVKEPLKLSLSVGVIDSVNCYNGSDGSITTSISGGSGSIKYLWNDAAKQTTSKTSNLTKGTYKLVVKDTYGCSDSITADVKEPLKLSLSVGVIDSVNCFSGSDGSITTSNTGGSGSKKYLWNDATKQTTSKASNLTKGTYKLVVKDTYGCSDSITADVKEPLKLSISVIVGKSVTNSTFIDTMSVTKNTGSVYTWAITGGLQQSGGNTNQITIKWDAGPITASVKVTETDKYGCTSNQASKSVNIQKSGAIQSLSDKGFLKLFPNPSKNVVTIELDGVKPGAYKISVINTLGQVKYENEWYQSDTYLNQTIDVSGLAKGVYSLKISNPFGEISSVLIKN